MKIVLSVLSVCVCLSSVNIEAKGLGGAKSSGKPYNTSPKSLTRSPTPKNQQQNSGPGFGTGLVTGVVAGAVVNKLLSEDRPQQEQGATQEQGTTKSEK